MADKDSHSTDLSVSGDEGHSGPLSISLAAIWWQQAKGLTLVSYMLFPSSFLKLPIVLVDRAIVLGVTAFPYLAGLAKVSLDPRWALWFTTCFKKKQCK